MNKKHKTALMIGMGIAMTGLVAGSMYMTNQKKKPKLNIDSLSSLN